MGFDKLRKAIHELWARMPKDTIWHLRGGGEFRSNMNVAELVCAGYKELEHPRRKHPIIDAAMETERSEDGSRFHELLAAVARPLLKERNKKRCTTRSETSTRRSRD
jgi:hypothetical protein